MTGLRGRRDFHRQEPRGGFTLIEVIGALVVFSVGVLMVVRLSTASGVQMRYAGVRSELAVRAAERIDSLEAEPFGGLTPGTDTDTLTVGGIVYTRAVTLTPVTPLLLQVDVDLAPLDGQGPLHSVRSYLSETW